MAFPQLESALQFACKAHAGTYRDGKFALPYVTHPVEVVVALRTIGRVTDDTLLAAAALHDVLEEAPQHADELEAQFSNGVISLVKQLTRQEPTDKQREALSEAQLWDLRTRMLLQGVAKMSDDAQVIKLADRLTNLIEARNTKTKSRFARYKRQTASLLKLIPKIRNERLWKAIRTELRQSS